MNTECLRIADQLRRAFEGKAWHGPALRESLIDITADQAGARPLASGHTIWELVLHIDLWAHVGFEAAQGVPMPKLYGTEKDWSKVTDASAAEWSSATDHLFQTAETLAQEIERFGDARLDEIVPGRQYNFYYLFHGIVQHSLYHAGQIALLKRAK
jgi:uncharacterized damage-inducible protein DinB